jgi:uncharacterized protein (DUF433 family)/DNA-binding XRE family transcriptional regulator
VDKVLGRLENELKDEESRYAYADAVTDAFLTGQIKALREERGLTQEELAKLIGTQQSGISRWLNSGFSSCKVESLRKFARAYGVRLRISFEEFGSLPADIAGFTVERLAPRKFQDDPVFKSQPNEMPEETELFRDIEIRPDVMMGKPCFKGTRIPVYLILEKLGAGETYDQILVAYPQLTKNHITVALQHAANLAMNEIVLAS